MLIFYLFQHSQHILSMYSSVLFLQPTQCLSEFTQYYVAINALFQVSISLTSQPLLHLFV